MELNHMVGLRLTVETHLSMSLEWNEDQSIPALLLFSIDARAPLDLAICISVCLGKVVRWKAALANEFTRLGSVFSFVEQPSISAKVPISQKCSSQSASHRGYGATIRFSNKEKDALFLPFCRFLFLFPGVFPNFTCSKELHCWRISSPDQIWGGPLVSVLPSKASLLLRQGW